MNSVHARQVHKVDGFLWIAERKSVIIVLY